MKLKVLLPSLSPGLRVGQVRRDPIGRELMLMHLLLEIRKALCLVQNRKARGRKSALIDLDHFSGFPLFADVPKKRDVCDGCGKKAMIFLTGSGERWCETACWVKKSKNGLRYMLTGRTS